MDNYRTLAARLRLFVDKQENIASFWDGNKTSGTAEDNAHTASELIELAQPLLNKLNELDVV